MFGGTVLAYYVRNLTDTVLVMLIMALTFLEEVVYIVLDVQVHSSTTTEAPVYLSIDSSSTIYTFAFNFSNTSHRVHDVSGK